MIIFRKMTICSREGVTQGQLNASQRNLVLDLVSQEETSKIISDMKQISYITVRSTAQKY